MKKNTWDETCLTKVVDNVLARTMQFFVFKVYMYSFGGFRKEGFFEFLEGLEKRWTSKIHISFNFQVIKILKRPKESQDDVCGYKASR